MHPLILNFFRPQIDFQANVKSFWTITSQDRPESVRRWLIRWQHRIRRGRFTPGPHPLASAAIDHALRWLPSSYVRRGHDRMGATPIREHGAQSSVRGS